MQGLRNGGETGELCVEAHINLTRWSQTGVEGDMCSLPNNVPAGRTEHEVTEFEWSASVRRSLRLLQTTGRVAASGLHNARRVLLLTRK